MGDGALSSWQGGNPGEPARLAALIEGCGLRARPLRQARGWGYQRLSALGTILVSTPRRRRRQRWPQRRASTLAFEMSDGAQRLVVNCGGPGRCRPTCPRAGRGLRTTAAHSTLTSPTPIRPHPRRRLARQGRRGRRHRPSARTMIRAGSRRATTAMSARFGLIHKRSLMLGNDGKELRGADQLMPRAARRSARRRPTRSASTSRRGVEATMTADGMGAILRSPGAPPWNFRCRGGNADDRGKPVDRRPRPAASDQRSW
jgi:uncharacterized heparinase superfamily protein